MKTKFLIFILPIACAGCSFNEKDEKTETQLIETPVINHEYSELDDRHILWDEIFDQQLNEYFVYFYSLTCNHCELLKNEIIEIGLNRDDVFFVKGNSQVVLKNDVYYTIGAGNVGDFAILGYPSLVKIMNGICIKNVAGKTQILNLLS